MRRYRAALTAAAALTLTLVTTIVAAPAQAGGPTSVLMVVPGTGQTASLYTGGGDYDSLARTVGAFSTTGAVGTVDGSGDTHEFGTGVTLTWLIHDVSVWRVDRVYLDAKGGPWILTQVDSSGAGNIWDMPAVWHTAVDGTVLADVLSRHGVAGVADTDSTATDIGPVQPDVAAVPDAPANDDATATDSRAGMLGWGLGGLALGVALTLAAMRLGQRSRPAQPPARDEAAPEDAAPDDGYWSAAEELQRR